MDKGTLYASSLRSSIAERANLGGRGTPVFRVSRLSYCARILHAEPRPVETISPPGTDGTKGGRERVLHLRS